LRQARKHFGSAPWAPLQLLMQSDWQLAVTSWMHACWQAEPSGAAGRPQLPPPPPPPLVVLVVEAVVLVVVLVVLAVVPVPVVVVVVVLLVTVVDVVVVVVVNVVVVVVLVVVDVVVGAEQEHARSRRHCRRACSAARAALRPQERRAFFLNVVHERLIESLRLRPHLFSSLMVSVQLPGRPGTWAAQTQYSTLASWVRLCRLEIKVSASAQSSTTDRVRS
jgi:hypothetical protein